MFNFGPLKSLTLVIPDLIRDPEPPSVGKVIYGNAPGFPLPRE